GDNSTKIQSIEQWGDLAWKTMSSAFMGCTKLTSNASDAPDLSRVTNMSSMFRSASSFDSDLSNWDVINVIDMSRMFYFASSFDSDLSTWDVSNVKDMSWMFFSASSFDSDLSNWDVSNVTNMLRMFFYASSFNGDLSTWEVSNVTTMEEMLIRSGLSVENYDKLLREWSKQSLQKGVLFGISIRYCEAAAERQKIIDDFKWMITDEGPSSLCNTAQRPFITTWETTQASEMITIPTNDFYYYYYNVDWGDGNIESKLTGSVSHVYATPGVYMVQITGDFPSIYFNTFSPEEGDNSTKIKSIEQWGDIAWETMNSAFMGCTKLTSNASDAPDLSLVRDMSSMFLNAASFNADISFWEVGFIRNMNSLFALARLFNQDLSSWDVSNVTDMTQMFQATSFDQDISSWNFNSAERMRFFSSNLSNQNYDKLLNSLASQTLKSNVTLDVQSYFCQSTNERQKIIDDFNWVINDNGQNCPVVNVMLSSTNLYENESESTQIGESFFESIGDIIVEDEESDTHEFILTGEDAEFFFLSRQSLFPNISFDYEGKSTYEIMIEVTDIGNNSLKKPFTIEILDDTLDNNPGFIFTWETTSPNESMRLPIDDSLDYNYTVIWGDGYANRGVEEKKNHSYSAPGIYSVEVYGDFPHFNSRAWDKSDQLLAIEQWGDIQWSTMENAFISCEKLVVNATDIPDLSQVTSTQGMFWGCESLTEGNLKSWDMANVLDMTAMFIGASVFNENIGSWNVSNAKEMNFMFAFASIFNQDISSWDVSNVENMNGLFTADTVFNQDISGWDVSSVTSMRSIFYNAKSFDQDLGTWEVVNVESFGDHRPFGGVFDADLISYGTFITLGGAFEGSGLSVANYDATLIGWSQIDNLRTNVELIATDKNFCTSYQERESLINNFNWMITDAEIADLCEEADHQILSVRDNKDLIVYPNPASDFITVNSDKQIQVLVYDLTGNLLLERDKNTINVSLLARGVYILKAFEENGETYSFRFQKE
ncbi:MAG: BspA family leucine-rich repeat surface protein, partial [Bacteroidota bacterium]